MILADRKTGVIVAGATGRQGLFHIRLMNEYAREVGGVGVVAGVTPGKGGQEAAGVPVYDSIRAALKEHDATASVIFVPASAAGDSIMESAGNGLETRGRDHRAHPRPRHHEGPRVRPALRHDVIGPNCPGLLSPGGAKLGIMPAQLAIPGPVGVVSRSGTLTYEIVDELTRAGIGQSTVVGIGGDPVIGSTFTDVFARFEADPATKAVVLVGEVGGALEQEGAASTTLPLVAYVAGVSAPPDKRMGHAGAIVEGGEGDARSKIRALEAMGVAVATRPSEIPALVRQFL